MLSWRWGGAILSAALVAGVAVVSGGRGGRNVDAAEVPPDGTWTLSGCVDAPGIDLSRCRARCSAMRLEESPVLHHTELDARGCFVFTGLADTDYCIEIVLRTNPALVVACLQHARPGGEEHVLLADPARIFGPSGHVDRDAQ